MRLSLPKHAVCTWPLKCVVRNNLKASFFEVLAFCFVLIHRLYPINRHQKRMTVMYRKQWSICLDGNLGLEGSWWKRSESLWCVDIALKTEHKHWVNTNALYLCLWTNELGVLWKMDSSVSHGLISAAGFGVACFEVIPSCLSLKSFRFNNLIVRIKCFRS